MMFNYVRQDDWPHLAWVAVIRKDLDEILVHHGDWVETSNRFFVEGVWDGKFEKGEFGDANWFLGSGAILGRSAVTFSTPSHMLERLYFLRRRQKLFVSNSLLLLLAQTNNTIDASYPFYVHDFSSMVSGLKYAASVIPISGGQLGLVYYSHLVVNNDLTVHSVKKPQTHSVGNYSEYISWLKRSVIAIVENGQSPDRKIPIDPLSTISSGYDSPACTILAQAAGCTEAITFAESRPAPGIIPEEDAGTQIAELLGLKVKVIDRTAYKAQTNFPEAEFLVGGVGGMDVILSGAESVLTGRLVITGFLGDTIWGTKPDTRSADDMSFTYPAGASLSEFRLRVGFIHFPIPQAHHFLLRDIAAITTSPEMANWSIGGDYDRPIPRRLVEEKGIPRELFATAKRAASQPFNRFGNLEAIMGSTSSRDFSEFLRDVPSLKRRHILRVWREQLQRRGLRRFPETQWLSHLIRSLGPLPSPGLESPVDWYHWSFHWAFEKLQGRY